MDLSREISEFPLTTTPNDQILFRSIVQQSAIKEVSITFTDLVEIIANDSVNEDALYHITGLDDPEKDYTDELAIAHAACDNSFDMSFELLFMNGLPLFSNNAIKQFIKCIEQHRLADKEDNYEDDITPFDTYDADLSSGIFKEWTPTKEILDDMSDEWKWFCLQGCRGKTFTPELIPYMVRYCHSWLQYSNISNTQEWDCNKEEMQKWVSQAIEFENVAFLKFALQRDYTPTFDQLIDIWCLNRPFLIDSLYTDTKKIELSAAEQSIILNRLVDHVDRSPQSNEYTGYDTLLNYAEFCPRDILEQIDENQAAGKYPEDLEFENDQTIYCGVTDPTNNFLPVKDRFRKMVYVAQTVALFRTYYPEVMNVPLEVHTFHNLLSVGFAPPLKNNKHISYKDKVIGCLRADSWPYTSIRKPIGFSKLKSMIARPRITRKDLNNLMKEYPYIYPSPDMVKQMLKKRNIELTLWLVDNFQQLIPPIMAHELPKNKRLFLLESILTKTYNPEIPKSVNLSSLNEQPQKKKKGIDASHVVIEI